MTSLDRDVAVAPGPDHFEATPAASNASTLDNSSPSGSRVLANRASGRAANRTIERPRPPREP